MDYDERASSASPEPAGSSETSRQESQQRGDDAEETVKEPSYPNVPPWFFALLVALAVIDLIALLVVPLNR